MPAVTLLRRAPNKAHPTQVPESDTGLLAGLELSAAGAASLYTDANTTAITIGSSGITTTVASGLQVNQTIFGPSDGTGIVVGATPAGASTGSTLQLVSVTTTQRDQLVAASGMMVYNSTTGVIEGYNGSTWNDLMAGAGGASSLAATLAVGQTTGGNDIILSTGDSLVGADELTLVSTTTGVVTLDSGTTGTINIGVDGTNAKTVNLDSGTTGALNIGTSAFAKTITIGNGTGATSLVLNAGTGNIDIGTGAFARSVNIATGAAAQAVIVGSTTGASSLLMQGGTGTVQITQAGGDAITIGQTGGAGTGSTLGLVSFTTAERDANLSPTNGMMIYNSTLAQIQAYQAGSWGSVGGVSQDQVADSTRFVVNGKPTIATTVDGAWIAPRAGTFTRITLYRRTAGGGGSTTVDVNKNGTTVYTTQANRPTVTAAGGNDQIDATTDFDVTTFAQDDRIEVDVDVVEAGNPQDISVVIEVQYS